MTSPIASIHYKNKINRDLDAYPVTYGIPLPPGKLKSSRNLGIRLDHGIRRPLQCKILERWLDGSIKWLLLDFEMPAKKNSTGIAHLEQAPKSVKGNGIRVTQTAARITVSTPVLTASFDRKRFSLFASYCVNGKEMIAPGSDILVEEPTGKRYYASDSKTIRTSIIEKGNQRVVVEVAGRNTAGDGSEMLTFRVRYTFTLNARGVMVAYKFTNREAPETGVNLSQISVLIPTALGSRTTKLVRQSNSGKHWYSRVHEIEENVELIAGGALNEAASNTYGNAADGKIVIRNLTSFRENLGDYPHFLRPGNARTDITGGLRSASPNLAMTSANGSAMVFFRGMDMNYPKGVAADRDRLRLDVWPAWAGDFLLRRGQSKQHDFFVMFDSVRNSHQALEDIYFQYEASTYGAWGGSSPAMEFTMNPDAIRSTQILDLHRWLRHQPSRNTLVEMKLGAIGPAGGLPQRGMMDFGDSVRPDRSWAHNNENDAILDSIREYYRQGKAPLLDAAIAKAYHNAHVDFIAFDPDPLRQGTMPAHCPEHVDGATYPSHMWVDGLLAAYCITGEPDFLDTALAVGENMLRWQADGTIFYADSRECGWPMLAFLRLYQQTHDQRWLTAAGDVFEHYRKAMTPEAEILYDLPHGVGMMRGGYGEFITWRACFAYYEQTGQPDVKTFLVKCLDKVYKQDPATGGVGGWASNDLFPAWAAYELTGDDKYLDDNLPFFVMLMQRQGNFPWGGVDMHYYLNALDKRGLLDQFATAAANSGVQR